MIPLLGAILIASLAGSLHCAGMCGAFVTLACGLGNGDVREKARLQVCYHGGRLVGYALLGTAAGAVGKAINVGASGVGLTHAASIFAAATIMLIAVGVACRALGVKLPHAHSPKTLQRAFRLGLQFVAKAQPTRRALAIGSLTALLPCGWLYAFVVVAAGTGQPTHGAIVMAAFWLGTVPILASFGAGISIAQRWFGSRTRAVLTVSIALASSVLLLRTATADLATLAASASQSGTVPTEAHCPLCESSSPSGSAP